MALIKTKITSKINQSDLTCQQEQLITMWPDKLKTYADCIWITTALGNGPNCAQVRKWYVNFTLLESTIMQQFYSYEMLWCELH